MLAFAVVVGFAIWQAGRPHHPKFQEALGRTMRTSGQLYIRWAILLIALMSYFAESLSLDVLLGAFMAGVIFRTLMTTGATHDEETQIELKLEALALGYLVPIFFVVTGIQYDLDALIGSPTALLKVPLFLVLLLVVRGVPVLWYRKAVPDPKARRALALFSATALPLIVAITHIGLATDNMRTSTAAALVGAGMLSIVIFPLVGSTLLGKGPASEPAEVVEPVC
ncbi:MAG: cation:proton antiporter [Acidimicrobiales bacterium]